VQDVAASVVRPDVAIVVETFPMLLKLPAWFPGMSFKNDMVTASKVVRRYVETTFDYALQRARVCSVTPSMVHDAMRRVEEKGTAPDEAWTMGIKDSAASASLAGSETVRHKCIFTLH